LPVEFNFDKEAGILRTTSSGVMTFEEIYNHWVDGRKAFGIRVPEIIDVRTAIHTRLTNGELRGLMWMLGRLEKEHDVGPTAFIVAAAVDFGLVRMQGVVAPIRVFWSEEEAEEWIAQQTPRRISGFTPR
jgi:hypothetical protein